MTAALVPEPQDELGELAGRINGEHALVQSLAGELVDRWIAIGMMLELARSKCGPGNWTAWVTANLDFGVGHACSYLRCAAHQEVLRAYVAEHGHKGGAHESIWKAAKGLPSSREGGVPADDALIQSIRELSAAGLTQTAIAAELGISQSTASKWLNPERWSARRQVAERKRREQRKAAKDAAKALEQKRRAEAARKIGGNGGDCYGDLRKALDRCHAAVSDAESPADRTAWQEAYRALTRAEAAVLDALHIERRDG